MPEEDERSAQEYVKMDLMECLMRLRWGRMLALTQEEFGDDVGGRIPLRCLVATQRLMRTGVVRREGRSSKPSSKAGNSASRTSTTFSNSTSSKTPDGENRVSHVLDVLAAEKSG